MTLLSALVALVGSDNVDGGDTPSAARYLYDGTATRGLIGSTEAVVRPDNAQEVARVVAWCYEHDVPIVPRGGGSGLAGGAVPIEGSVVLSLERLTRVRVFEPELWRMHVEAGVRTRYVRNKAREHGLWFPPDPGAADRSHIGGNAATNAGGPHAFRHGQFGDWVTGVEAVVAPGELVRFGGPVRKDVAGYDLKHLFIGSEGTLGVITAVWLRLIPAPADSAVIAACFPNPRAGCEAVLDVLARGLHPDALDFIDARAFEATVGFPGQLPNGFLVLAAVHGSASDTARQRDELMTLLGQHATTTLSLDPATLWQWRSGVSDSVSALIGGKLSEDVAVPVERLADAFDRLAAIGESHGLESCSWGHLGDGNVHATFLVRRTSHSDIEAAELAAADVFTMAIEFGGTITGEHGVGAVKCGWLADQWAPAAVALHEQVKLALDPKGLFNPGKKLARLDRNSR